MTNKINIYHLNGDEIALYGQYKALGEHSACDKITQRVEEHIQRCLLCRQMVKDHIELLESPLLEPSEQGKELIRKSVAKYMKSRKTGATPETPEESVLDTEGIVSKLYTELCTKLQEAWEHWTSTTPIVFGGASCSTKEVYDFKDPNSPLGAHFEKEGSKVSCWLFSRHLELKGVKVILKAGEIQKEFVLEQQRSEDYIGYKLIFTKKEQSMLPPTNKWQFQLIEMKQE